MINRRTLMNSFLFVALSVAASTQLSAQWPNYPTRGVPKTKDGKPDLNASTPRMPDGKPDLTGLWEAARGPANGQRGAAAPSNSPLPAEAPPPPNPDGGPPLATFFNIG